MIEPRFSARHPHFDGSVRREELRPIEFLCPPLELVKCTGVKSSQPQNHAASRAQPQVGEIKAVHVGGECDTAWLLPTLDAECRELTGRYRFQTWGSDGKKLESGATSTGW